MNIRILFFLVSLFAIGPLGYAQHYHNVGVLLASHGDIDSLTELKPYLKNAALHMAPVPGSVSGLFSEIAWPIIKAKYEGEYKAFGVKTNYRENSRKQADAIEKQLGALGIHGKVYVGFNLLSPTVDEALDQMRADGVETIIVINQGAQFSMATSMNYGDVIHYLKQHADYKPHVMGINQYSTDERFRTLLAESVREDVQTYFPDAQNDVCVLMAFHGLPEANVKKGDKSTQEMINLFNYVRDQIPEHQFFYGFLNEDTGPFNKWTTPTVVESGAAIGHAGCNHVLLDAKISLTVHPRVALYNLNILARQEIIKQNPYAVIVLAHNFNGDEKLGAFFAQLTLEALGGKGDLKHISADSTGGHHGH